MSRVTIIVLVLVLILLFILVLLVVLILVVSSLITLCIGCCGGAKFGVIECRRQIEARFSIPYQLGMALLLRGSERVSESMSEIRLCTRFVLFS